MQISVSRWVRIVIALSIVFFLGQNALAQVKSFDDALGLTGLIVTKLDGTAKGGILAAIARQRPIPVYFIGVGEKVEDLQPFSADEFADALLGN